MNTHSPSADNTSEPNTLALQRKSKICTHEKLSFHRLRRIATSLNVEKIGSYVDTLTCRSPQRLRSQWVILQDNEELACCDPVKTSSETLFAEVQVKGHFWRAKGRSGSDTGLQSTVNWYFWSPETAKNCPSLDFLRIHLAPTNVWLQGNRQLKHQGVLNLTLEGSILTLQRGGSWGDRKHI